MSAAPEPGTSLSAIAHAGASRRAGLLAALLAVAVAVAAPCVGHAQRMDDVRLGRVGDRWLDLLQHRRIARDTRDGVHGYAVTYDIPGHGELILFWPRERIDLQGGAPHARPLTMPLRTGRLVYPDTITARSLPDIHRGILILEASYARQADGFIAGMEGFALIAGLGAPAAPGIRRVPALPAPRPAARAPRPGPAPARARTASAQTAGVAPARAAPAPAPIPVPAAQMAQPSARALARAMEAAGYKRPPGAATHHIVAGNAPQAERARVTLRRFGIDINDAANGVFLPANRMTSNPAGAAVHSTLHTRKYYDMVNKMLDKAETRAHAEAILKRIRQKLLSGGE